MYSYNSGYSIAMPRKPPLILPPYKKQAIILLYTHSVRQMNFRKTYAHSLKNHSSAPYCYKGK